MLKLIFVIFTLMMIYKHSSIIPNLIKKLKRIRYVIKPLWLIFKEKKKFCAYCKYSIYSDDGNYYCLKYAETELKPTDVLLIPELCEEVNYNLKCKDFKFDWLWWIK